MPLPRASAVDLGRLLEASSQPIYAVDDELRIVFCNSALCEWIGVPSDELVGQVCRYHSEPETDAAAAAATALCPPPETLSGLRRAARLRPAGPRAEARSVEFIPLGDGERVVGVLARVLPVDEDSDAETGAAWTDDAAQLHARVASYRRQLAAHFHVDRLIGDSPAMRKVRAQIAMASGVVGNVLIVGPPGSGRQHVARAIHAPSGQPAPGPLVPLACDLLGAELIQSSLRGLQRGKGASRPTATLLLNDADRLTAAAQAELAAHLPGFEFPLRVISTARAPLLAVAPPDGFRADLASLLSTLTIELPPLAERRDDIPILAQWFLEQCNARAARQLQGFNSEALDCLATYAWPGQVEELQAAVVEAHGRAEGVEVTPRDLPSRLRLSADAAARPRRIVETIVLEDYLAEVERELVQRALAQAKGNKSRAARLLGMTRPRLYRRLVQLGLEPGPLFESPPET